MENNSELIALCEAKAKQWLTPVFDADTQATVKGMLDNEDKTELIESSSIRILSLAQEAFVA